MADLNRRQTTVNALREVQRFVDDNNFVNASVERLKVQLANVRRNALHFQEIHDRLIGADIPQAEFDVHEQLRADIQNLIIDLEANLLERIGVLNQPPPVVQQQPPVQPAAQDLAQAQEMRHLLAQNVKNTWGEFDGTLSKWRTFKEMFTAAVHNAAYLTNVSKFQQLLKSLKSEAAEVLEGWQVTDGNYVRAWQRLNAVYDLPHQTGTQLVKKLNELPKIERANRKQLQHLSNVANSVLLQMNDLGYNMEHCDIMFMATLEEKLDRFSRREWEMIRTNAPTLQQFLAFVDKQARSAPDIPIDSIKGTKPNESHKRHHDNTVQSSHPPKKFRSGAPSNSKGELKPEKSKEHAHFQLKCPMNGCGLSHQLYRCPKYLACDVAQREKFMKANKLCLNCTYPGHFAKFCRRDGCHRCEGKKHNSTICPGNPFWSKANVVKLEHENNQA